MFRYDLTPLSLSYACVCVTGGVDWVKYDLGRFAAVGVCECVWNVVVVIWWLLGGGERGGTIRLGPEVRKWGILRIIGELRDKLGQITVLRPNGNLGKV